MLFFSFELRQLIRIERIENWFNFGGLQLPEDIEWHFIGNLQSNKVKPLLSMSLIYQSQIWLLIIQYQIKLRIDF